MPTWLGPPSRSTRRESCSRRSRCTGRPQDTVFESSASLRRSPASASDHRPALRYPRPPVDRSALPRAPHVAAPWSWRGRLVATTRRGWPSEPGRARGGIGAGDRPDPAEPCARALQARTQAVHVCLGARPARATTSATRAGARASSAARRPRAVQSVRESVGWPTPCIVHGQFSTRGIALLDAAADNRRGDKWSRDWSVFATAASERSWPGRGERQCAVVLVGVDRGAHERLGPRALLAARLDRRLWPITPTSRTAAR